MPTNSSSMDFGPATQQFDPSYSHDALKPGTRLGGYQIIEVLGRGGFGIVYLALDSSLQRQVAIKEYLPAELAMRCEDGQVWVRPGADPAAYAAGMTAFLSEAKMLARFDHPSLARVHTFWEENRSAYMVMPYYDGRTLAAILAEMSAPPDEAWLRSLLTPLLSALSTLHNAQCLHLDISPDNIIVLKDGRPVLLDFGVASRLATDKTMPLTALLNPAYAPIEQYSETATLPQGPWSDLYALASVLHFAIAGRPPARATVRAMDDPQRPLAETVAARAEQYPGLAYSESFLAAIDKALAVRPRERPRSAAEFQMLLDNRVPPAARAMAGEPPAFSTSPGAMGAPPMPAPGLTSAAAAAFAEPPREAWFAAEPRHAPIKPRRNRKPLFIATVATLGLLSVGGWAWLQRQPSLAQITAADLPPAVVARIPKAASAVANGAPATQPAPGDMANAPATAATNPGVNTPASAPAAATQAGATPPTPQAAPAPPVVAQTAPASAPAPSATPGAAATTAAAPVAATTSAAAAPASAPAGTGTAATAQAPLPTQATAAGPTTTAAPPAEASAATPEKLAAAPAPARTKKPAKTAPAAQAAAPAPAEPNNPRAVCGARSNFALVYCMQQQCRRWKFTNHPQCIEMERRGEL